MQSSDNCCTVSVLRWRCVPNATYQYSLLKDAVKISEAAAHSLFDNKVQIQLKGCSTTIVNIYQLLG